MIAHGFFQRLIKRLVNVRVVGDGFAAACKRLCLSLGGGFVLSLSGCFLIEERLAIGHGDLVIVGMDFVEGQESVAIAAVFDEGGLERRLHARDLGEVDIAAQ